MNNLKTIASTSNVEENILKTFQEVTRYPLEILDPNANLEEDLGIDSVKLGEIFAVLREAYGLPETIEIPPEQLKSINGITSAIVKFLDEKSLAENSLLRKELADIPLSVNPPNGINNNVIPNEPTHKKENVHQESARNRILEIFAEITRYPSEILDPQANLEEDLGIDSVKLGEIFAVMREEFQLPEQIEIPVEQLKTINGIAVAIDQFLAGKLSADGRSSILNDNGNGMYKTPVPATNGQSNQVAELRSVKVDKPSQNKPLEGKVAFISGSGRGLGKDIGMYLASQGASVIINSFHSREKGKMTVQEIKDNGGKAHHIWGSVANPTQLDKIFEEIEEQFGGIDFFIGNASNGMLARLEDITTEHWEKAFRTNIIGLHQSAMWAARLMKKRGGGKIITLSSPAAHGYVDYFGCMGAVKAAVESLTRSLAVELSPFNIQVNCVSPGPVYGALLNKWPESKRLIAQWEENTVSPRLCEARDVSHFIAYLLQDDVKLFTGSVLVIDGGISSRGW